MYRGRGQWVGWTGERAAVQLDMMPRTVLLGLDLGTDCLASC
jgi:hypothetical protein